MHKSTGTAATPHELIIEIGEMPILVRSASPEFARLLQDRYSSFVLGPGLAGDGEQQGTREVVGGRLQGTEPAPASLPSVNCSLSPLLSSTSKWSRPAP
jgi:hypothetical protein